VLTEYEYRGGSTNLDCAEYSRIIFFLLIVSYCQKAQQGSTRLNKAQQGSTRLNKAQQGSTRLNKAQQGLTRLNKAWKSEDAWYLSGLINMSFG